MKTQRTITDALAGITVMDFTDARFSHLVKWFMQLGASVSSAGESPDLQAGVPYPDVVIELEGTAGASLSVMNPVLKAQDPGLIRISISGSGCGEGPSAPPCDIVAAASGGQMFLSGLPEKSPLKAYGNQSFFCASLYALIGCLLALRQRRKTGRGCHIDISLQEVVASTLEPVLVRYLKEHCVTGRSGTRHWTGAFAILPCKDGYLSISPLLNWDIMVNLMDADDMAGDLMNPEWQEPPYREARLDYVLENVAAWLMRHTRHWLFETAQLMRLPWAPVQSPAEIRSCPQLASRDFFADTPANAVRPAGFPFQWTCVHGPSGQDKTARFGGCAAGDIQGKGILSGVRILDFSRVLAGPFATRLLADFGAEVIKVQSAGASSGAEDNTTHQFHAVNRNKLGITLNMNLPRAREIARDLVAQSDVVLENFSPRVMHNWGMDFKTLQQINRRLIMVRMSAMGQTGPWQNFAGYGSTVQALGGLDYLTAYAPGSPVGVGYAYADIISGLYGAFSVLAALAYRDRSGAGQLIDLSEYEVVCAALVDTLQGNVEKDAGTSEPDESRIAAPYGCYRCQGQDNWCVIAVFTDLQWEAVCRVAGKAYQLGIPEFSTAAQRCEHAGALDESLGRWTQTLRAEQVVSLLSRAGVPAGMVQDAGAVAKDPILSGRQFIQTDQHPVYGSTFSLASPVRSLGGMRDYQPAPQLGEHNRYVYRNILGLGEKAFVSACQDGVFS